MTSGRDSNGCGSSKLIKECFKSHLRWSEWHFRVGVKTKLIKRSYSPELCWKLQHRRISEVSKLVYTLIIYRERKLAPRGLIVITASDQRRSSLILLVMLLSGFFKCISLA